jgi:hypothetical protein
VKQSDLNKWKRYFEHRNTGLGIDASATKARIASTTAHRFERGDQSSQGLEAASILGVTSVAGNLVDLPLSPEALRALEDFAYFRRRYFGRRSTPWQERAAYDVLRALETGDREYIVINCPPGSGKSTLFTCDIPCWLIARDRTIRIQIGSRTERQARMYVGRIKRALERDAPVRTDADSLAAKIAFDADACLMDDYGSFRPEGRSELWRAEALVCRQLDGVALDDKEPTVSAWGMDSGFLGGRFDLVLWDDLVDKKTTRTPEAKEALREWWATEAETRLEPRGALILQGQRILHDDLYKSCLEATTLNDERKYRHVLYRAHDDERCTGDHDGEQKPWPEGCLLDPWRLPWRQLETVKRNSPRTFQVQYQQEDGDLTGGLVEEAWIKGGIDSEGYPAPGCLDNERAIGAIPEHLTDGRAWSFVTVDPSPTEYWSVQWWLYDPDTSNRYLIDSINRRMNPEQFLDFDLEDYSFSGVLEDIRKQSLEVQAPIRDVIFEINAAQRWFLHQPHVQRWIDVTGVRILPHTTSANKADPKFGVESLGVLFRDGLIRLPYQGPSTRMKIQSFIDEHLRYPDSDTDDTVMADWFHHLAVIHHFSPHRKGLYSMEVPSWVSRGRGGLPVERGLSYSR